MPTVVVLARGTALSLLHCFAFDHRQAPLYMLIYLRPKKYWAWELAIW